MLCSQDTLLFRPSGGDTMAQTRTAVSKLITWEGQHYARFSVRCQGLSCSMPQHLRTFFSL